VLLPCCCRIGDVVRASSLLALVVLCRRLHCKSFFLPWLLLLLRCLLSLFVVAVVIIVCWGFVVAVVNDCCCCCCRHSCHVLLLVLLSFLPHVVVGIGIVVVAMAWLLSLLPWNGSCCHDVVVVAWALLLLSLIGVVFVVNSLNVSAKIHIIIHNNLK